MNFVKKVWVFFSFDTRTKLLFYEAFILLGWARILKSASFSKVVPSLGTPMEETAYETDHINKKTLLKVSHAINTMGRYTSWESKCLVKAIAGMKMLERRHIDSTLYLGTAKDENGKLIAHAWLRSGSLYITGSEEMGTFTVVSKFAKRVSDKNNQGENHGEQLQS